MKKTLFVIYFLFLISVFLKGQDFFILQKQLDSLMNTSPEDSTVFSVSKKLFDLTIDKKAENAVQYAALCQQYAMTANDSIKLAESYNMLGECYLRQKSYFMATEAFFKAYEIFHKHERDLACAYTLVNIARAYIAQEIEGIADEKLNAALEIFEKKNDSLGIALVYENKGLANMQDNQAKAVAFFKKATAIYEHSFESKSVARNNLHLAELYSVLGNSDSALFFIKKSVDIFEKMNDSVGIAQSYNQYAKILKNSNRLSLARKYFVSSLEYASKIFLNDIAAEDYLRLAEIYLDNGDFEYAKKLLRKSIFLAEMFNYLEILSEAYKIMSYIFETQTNYDSALKYSKLYTDAVIRNYEMKNTQHFSSFQMNLEKQNQEKELELFKIKAEKERLQMEKKQYKRNTFYGTVIVFLAVLFLIFLILRNREKNKTAQKLREANEMLKHEISVRKKAENDMRSSEERYRLLFKKTPIGIMQFDENLIISDANDKILEILDIPKNKIVKSPLNKIFDRNTVREIVAVLDGKKEIYVTETEIISKSKVVFIAITVKRYEFETSEGTVKGGIIIIEDLTMKKRAEHFYKTDYLRKQLIFKLLPDNLILVNFEKEILEAHLPNSPHKEVSSQKIEDILPQDIAQNFFNYFNIVKETMKPQRFVLEGQQGNLFFRIIPDKENNVILIIISKLTQKGEQILSDKAKFKKIDKKTEYLRNLRMEIETELLPTFQNIQRGLSFIMLKNFAEKILEIAEKYKNLDLKNYGTELMNAITSFNVLKVNEMVDKFPIFISEFTQMEEIMF